MSNRKVIFHYHYFKNAGTSLDMALKESLGTNNWATREFPSNQSKNNDLVKEWLIEKDEVVCFSSHTAHLPLPAIAGIDILPILFIRHPLDRVASVYTFESTQKVRTFGSVLASNTSMGGYIETRLALPNDRQCRNFHVHRLAMMFPASEGSELQRAKKAITKLDFVGLVEYYNESIQALNNKIAEFGFDCDPLNVVKKNVSRKSGSLDEKLITLEEDMGESSYKELVEANEQDLELYDFVRQKYFS